MSSPSEFLVQAFLAVAVATYVAFVAVAIRADRRRGVIFTFALTAWLLITYGLAALGKLQFWPPPPTMGILIVLTLIATVVLARSSFGRTYGEATPLAMIVGLNAFRLPLELVMHRAAAEGVMPPQMTYTGWNFDIVTGISAIIVGVLLLAKSMSEERRRTIARIWNYGGFALLLLVLTVAILSSPGPLRRFQNEPANVWVTQPPFVWLVTLLVPVALFSHVVLFRRLRRT